MVASGRSAWLVRLGLLTLLTVTGWLYAPMARAETIRRAVLVSHGDGGPGLPKLRYTRRDVSKVRDVLVDLGGFEKKNIIVVQDQNSVDALKTLRDVETKVRADKAGGHQTILFVYYSGHAKDGSLRLGKSKLDMNLVRSLLEESVADVRVAVIDACGAGELTREKGGHKAPPLVVRVDDGLTARGQVIIASSSETEASQESDDIQGSFFTHYWVSGLRGDADRNADASVTLDEAYQYAYQRTVAATLNTRGGIQHPTYRYNLRGAGDVVMSSLSSVSSSVTFPEGMVGRYIVFDMERQLVVAEVEKKAGKPLRLALKGGTYAIKKRESDHLLMQRVKIAQASEVQLDPKRMEKVSFEKDYTKGSIIEVDGPSPPGQGFFGLSLSGGLGAQGFVSVPLQRGISAQNIVEKQTTFPATTIITMQSRYHGLLNKHLLLGADLNFGLRDYTASISAGPRNLNYDARFFLAEAGGGVMWEQELWILRFAAGPRLSGIFTWRHFLDSNVPVRDQFFLNLTPGVAAYVGVDIFRFLHAELGFRGNIAVFAIDGFQGIGYGSMTLALHADL